MKEKYKEMKTKDSIVTADYENVDFILVYDIMKDNAKLSNQEKRRTFESNLIKTGVKLSKVDGISHKSLCFVIVKIPWPVLLTFADIMKMKKPLKTKMARNSHSTFDAIMTYLPDIFAFPRSLEVEENRQYLNAFRKDKQEIFQIEPKKTFFTKSQRSLIAYEILIRTQWSDALENFGIERLIKSGIYITAYSLHEGKFNHDANSRENLTERQILYDFWAKPIRFYKYQPMSLIRKYFGEKIAIYFSWLGFYTFMLIPASIFGSMGFIYNLSNFGNDEISKETCLSHGIGQSIMCPLCDENCDYWRLNESCLFSKVAAVFDNTFTIIFAIFMSVWGSIFLQFWKRQQTDLQFSWNTNDYDEMENERLEFELHCKRQRINPITGELEWYMSHSEKMPRKFVSFCSVLLMVSLVLSVVLAIIMVRIILTGLFYRFKVSAVTSYTKLVTSGLTAFIDLCAIIILDSIYRIIAVHLTNFENPRTETEYDDSLTLKMYLFQFFNFYSSLFYIAFLKGSFIGRPGKYTYIFLWRQEECDPAGCLMELSIQMIVIFVGKQVLNNMMELSYPYIKKKWKLLIYGFKQKRANKQRLLREQTVSRNSMNHSSSTGSHIEQERNNTNIDHFEPQWERDFYLMDTTQMDLFDEYLEMVIQYGFVTLFAAAMPLAPLFALINNVIEIRIDAYKMLTKWKRPLAKQAQDIGIWNDILRVISILAVVSNAFIISYTSSAIPQFVYRYYFNGRVWSLSGYVNFSLSDFQIKDFDTINLPVKPSPQYGNITSCRYRDFRDNSSIDNQYNLNIIYWHVLAARLAFVIAFEHFVFFLAIAIDWLVPTVSSSIKIRIEQEKLLNKKLMFQAGTEDLNRILELKDPDDIMPPIFESGESIDNMKQTYDRDTSLKKYTESNKQTVLSNRNTENTEKKKKKAIDKPTYSLSL